MSTLKGLFGKYFDNAQDNSCQNKNQVQLSPVEKQNLIEELFGKKNESDIIDDQGIESLELEDVCSAFGDPQTIFGKKLRNDLFFSPTLDQAVLSNRSNIIQALSKDGQLQQELQKVFANIAHEEDTLLRFFLDEDEIVEKTIDQFYFSTRLNFLNKNSLALEGRRLATYAWHSLSLVPPTAYGVLIGGLTQYASISLLGNMLKNKNLSLMQRTQLQQAHDIYCQQFKSMGYEDIPGKIKLLYSLPFKALGSTYKTMVSAHNPMKSKNLEQRNTLATFGDQFNFVKNFEGQKFNGMDAKILKAGIYVKWVTQCAIDAWCIQRSKSSKQALLFREEIIHSIQSQMHSLSILYNALEYVTKFCQKNSEIAENFIGVPLLIQFCNHAEELSLQLDSLLSHLRSSSLKNSPSFFSNQGKALAAYNLMKETKEMWLPALKVLGEFEVYMEIAKKINSGQLCFATAIANDGPYIETYACKNPRVINDQGQDFLIGTGAPVRHMLITGPHGGGKSIGQKTIVYNILSAMAFNVAFAKSFIYTPIDKIFVYCNIKENVEAGLSSFMAECARIDVLESELVNMEIDKNALILTDEVFKGTMEEEGAKRYYEFCKKVSTHSNALLVAITHFEKLTDLESDTDGLIKNYQIELLSAANGEFERTFKLRPGKSGWWFNNSEQRTQYIEWLKKQN